MKGRSSWPAHPCPRAYPPHSPVTTGSTDILSLPYKVRVSQPTFSKHAALILDTAPLLAAKKTQTSSTLDNLAPLRQVPIACSMPGAGGMHRTPSGDATKNLENPPLNEPCLSLTPKPNFTFSLTFFLYIYFIHGIISIFERRLKSFFGNKLA